MRALPRLGAALTVLGGLAACGAPAADPAPPPSPALKPAAAHHRLTADEARKTGADELGRIPVLMYHRLTANPKSVYERTPADFTAELERLARERYVPVTTAALTARRLDLPAGTHPVVLTFDDGDPSVFTLTPQGHPAPGSAIGILFDVAARHPGFTPVASLYVNQRPFGDPDGAHTLSWLNQHGFEIGNHTLAHANLRTVSAEAAQDAIRAEAALIQKAVPGYVPSTLALPYGSRPLQAGLAQHGDGYSYTGVLLVGAGPAPSPYSRRFDPGSIPRIRSQSTGRDAGYGSAHWLDELASPSGRRYTSDGDPAVVSYPRSEAVFASSCPKTCLAY
ncbi:polysaccharide deacetylase family protein [Amycolatopsis rubida]|uniref:Polysaccharide deacetylase family protein n=1 Tax=Amycolatopsis rubida TaxID=112413 RepID=A0ABX0BM80_9PSEU|nr:MULTISPECIES: polysaccharide deacetylase family protein [Amycolatopsis]MYW90250.1 polysaccharide deacetylase family protein [Amycolatopsis rubida]NEC55227.1 polysaccharide deacetylase family protein [Amycolatopsis rubida]OAP21791.1 Polysaccharide deacetylase [Amycolatopsis sp. M39]